MQEILDYIYDDHRNMARVLTVLDAEIDDLKSGDDHDISLVADIVDYFNHYPAQFHHPLEDRLFDKCVSENDELASAIAELRHEHEAQGDLGAELALYIKAVQAGHMVPREETVARLSAYVDNQRRHMRKEEQVFSKLKKGSNWEDGIELPDRASADGLFGSQLRDSFATLAESINRA